MKSPFLDNRNPWLVPRFALATNEKQYKEILKQYNIISAVKWLTGFGATHTFYANASHDMFFVVCIKLDPTETLPVVCGVLAHEATHVFDRFCEDIGEDSPSKEFRAYSMQFITYRLVEEYLARVKRISNVRLRK